jgi:hypothetical protein
MYIARLVALPSINFATQLHTTLSATSLKMSNSSFYGTTVPVLRSIAQSGISFLTAARDERKSNDSLPSEQDALDAKFGDMLPARMQPIIFAKFAISGVETLKLSSTDGPAMDPSSWSSFDDVIKFFEQVVAVFDAVDEKKFNEAAQKSVDVPVANTTLHMTGMQDYYNSFVVPNSYFHLNALYMLLRSKGFTLGKGKYINSFMSEQQMSDWAPLRG